MKDRYASARAAAFLLSAVLLLASCGSGMSAATMHLVKTEGTVGVSDGDGRNIDPMDNLGLYSGYQVGTRVESYAWINLDDVKLAKMDAESQVEIAKDGGKLEINVKSGSLFFNVTEPLADDESMDIRTSSMMVGIRGTCGWVTENTAALLEGTVTVTAEGQSATVSAGEMAALTDEGVLEVRSFPAYSIPAFVREEVAEDENLTAAIQDTIGMDLSEADTLAPYADVLSKLAENGEILYTEELDFEADGSPELLVLCLLDKANPDREAKLTVSVNVYRSEPEGSSLSVMRCTGTFYNHESDLEIVNGRFSLVESEGRLFIKYSLSQHYSDNNISELEWYWGSIAQQDGSEQEWGNVEIIDRMHDGSHVYHSYRRHPKKNGFVDLDSGGISSISAEEYAAIHESYKELKILAYTPDNASLVVMPDPSEVEEILQSIEAEESVVEP